MTLRVLIADDHPPTRLGVRLSLEDAGMQVVGEVASAGAAVERVLALRPDIALLDIHMPGSGIEATRQITANAPEVAVVMLTVSRDDNDLFDALCAGARGYLLKDTDPVRLPLALEGVLAGEAALPRGLVARLVDEFRTRDARTHRRARGVLAALTEREWEILMLMRDGRSTQEIAGALYVSPVTVRSHIAAVLRKLKVPDREAAVSLVE